MLSVFKCHLSTPCYRQPNQSNKEYIVQRRNYFNKTLKNKTTIFRNVPTKLVYSNLPGNKCFNKFAYGKEEFHIRKDGKKPRIDRHRLERLDWIFEIIDNIKKCKNCNKYHILNDKNHHDRINIFCEQNNYKVVISLKKTNDCYLILTAFYTKIK